MIHLFSMWKQTQHSVREYNKGKEPETYLGDETYLRMPDPRIRELYPGCSNPTQDARILAQMLKS